MSNRHSFGSESASKRTYEPSANLSDLIVSRFLPVFCMSLVFNAYGRAFRDQYHSEDSGAPKLVASERYREPGQYVLPKRGLVEALRRFCQQQPRLSVIAIQDDNPFPDSVIVHTREKESSSQASIVLVLSSSDEVVNGQVTATFQYGAKNIVVVENSSR